jgi:hypothetical protein
MRYFWFAVYTMMISVTGSALAQDIESQLSGNGAAQGFTVRSGTGTPLFTIRGDGKVGVGLLAPDARLHVDGQIKISGGSPGLGKVLTSDANGLATWSMPTAGGLTLNQAYNHGGAGAGRGITADAGAVHVSGVDGFLVTGTLNSGVIPASGSGVRMMFYPRKAAFRAGSPGPTDWEDANIGIASAAFGSGRASGQASFATGVSIASGSHSAAFGYGIASDEYAFAAGDNAVASGKTAISLGTSTLASGRNAVALGDYSQATGDAATAVSNGRASGEYSVALGKTFARSMGVTAVGQWNIGAGSASTWVATDPIFEVGNSNNFNSPSNALTVLKNGNVGIGTHTPDARLVISGQVKITGGVPGAGKVLVSDANGLASWGAGFSLPFTHASSSSATLFNVENTGAGLAGAFKSAGLALQGWSTNNASPGVYARANSTSGLAFSAGSTGANSTAFSVSGNGTTTVGPASSTPQYLLNVYGSAGKSVGGTSWSTISDARLKTVDGVFTRGLETILQLRPVQFRYKDIPEMGLSGASAEIGFIAQEVQAVFPECVTQREDGYLDFNIHPLNVAMVNAIQQLQAEKDDEIATLRNQLVSANRELESLRRYLDSGQHATAALQDELAALRDEMQVIRAALENGQLQRPSLQFAAEKQQ